MIERYEVNTKGRDFIVGDLHGCYDKLEALLRYVGFDYDVDRLFSLGDLCDRGPYSAHALHYLKQPWFNAIRGNHEQMAVDIVINGAPERVLTMNGGEWFLALPNSARQEFADAFSKLPLAIELPLTDGRLLGLVHAEVPFADWKAFTDTIQENGARAEYVRNVALWGRSMAVDAIKNKETFAGVANIDEAIIGHTALRKAVKIKNLVMIDTGAGFEDGGLSFYEPSANMVCQHDGNTATSVEA